MADPLAGVLIDSTYTTVAQIMPVYIANLGYSEGAGNLQWAWAFRRAAMALLRLQPQSTSADGLSRSVNQDMLRKDVETVNLWLQANDPAQNQGQVVITDSRLARW